MKRIIINTVLTLFVLLFVVVLVLSNTWYRSVPVATVPGSYAESYAKSHRLDNLELSDSLGQSFDIRYESFDYNIGSEGLVIEGYSGESTSLVVPQTIMGMAVTSIGDSFFESCPNVSEVYLPLSVSSIESESRTGVLLHIDPHSVLTGQLEEDGWLVNEITDSEYIALNFCLGDNPFIYNYDEGGIEITGFTGDERIIIIPSHIDGKPVTKISMTLLGYKGVVIPETVNEITGRTYKYYVDITLVIGLVFAFIAFVAALVSINKIIPGKQGNNPSIIAPSLAGISMLFLLLVLGINAFIFVTGNLYSPVWILVIDFVLVGGYVLFVSVTASGEKHMVSVKSNQQAITAPTKNLKRTAAIVNFNAINDSDIKNRAQKLMEEIKYFAPASSTTVQGLDEKINEAIDKLNGAIDASDVDVEQSALDELELLIQQRSNINRV